MAADTNALGALHAQLATVFAQVLQPREEPIVNKEGEVVGTRIVMPTAAEMSAAAAFLKNNNITADIDTNDELKALQDVVARRRDARAKRAHVLDDPDAISPTLN